ncbi:hypothetical protein niasHT_028661 [Heterodera trifolii]|uniref:Uncharacterized protein n=1 Tax=Heterodera trifolii TaxID=157864 RepID=A0ABD2K0J9_9BILA
MGTRRVSHVPKARAARDGRNCVLLWRQNCRTFILREVCWPRRQYERSQEISSKLAGVEAKPNIRNARRKVDRILDEAEELAVLDTLPASEWMEHKQRGEERRNSSVSSEEESVFEEGHEGRRRIIIKMLECMGLSNMLFICFV